MKANKKTAPGKGAKDKDLDFDFEAIARAKPLTREEEAAIGLPSPEELADKAPSTKITIAVDDDALEFFRGEAKRLKTSYQRMMRNLLSAYARSHRQPVKEAAAKSASPRIRRRRTDAV